MINNTSPRVLVVDDDKGIVETMRDILSASGYEVDVAHSGYEALGRIEVSRPDIVLLDIRMPDISGLDVFRELKNRIPEIPVVFITAYMGSAQVESARTSGAVDVLAKPLNVPWLLDLIQRTVFAVPILIVDDDYDFSGSLKAALETSGFDVMHAAGLDDAVVLMERHSHPVVLLDMRLNGTHGLDALAALKELNSEGVVILMSGYPEETDAMKSGVGMTAAAYFLKPFDIEELSATIRTAVRAQATTTSGIE